MDSTISNDELARRLDDLIAMFREDLAEIKAAQAAYVLREVYEARHTALKSEVTKLETRLTQESDQRRNLSRWVWGTLVVPVFLFIGQIVINAQGGAS